MQLHKIRGNSRIYCVYGCILSSWCMAYKMSCHHQPTKAKVATITTTKNLDSIYWSTISSSSIINRGKALNSAMSSLQNFDKSIDNFLAWLSEAESTMECAEVETDRQTDKQSSSPLLKVRELVQLRSNL